MYMRQHNDKKQTPVSPSTAGCSQLGWIYRKKVSCCFSPPACCGAIKKAVNQVFQAHLSACHNLVTQVILEHHLMARSHTHSYTHTHRACFAAGFPTVLTLFAFCWCLTHIAPWPSMVGWEKSLTLCGREQEAWVDAETYPGEHRGAGRVLTQGENGQGETFTHDRGAP